jgi:hypothetical protein
MEKVKVSIYLPPEDLRRIRTLAAIQGMTLSGLFENFTQGEINRAIASGFRFSLNGYIASPAQPPVEEPIAETPQRKKRGRKPLSPEEKADRAAARAIAKAEVSHVN